MTRRKIKARPGGAKAPVSPIPAHRCDLCGHGMVDTHCKLRCANCGYTRDCSDP